MGFHSLSCIEAIQFIAFFFLFAPPSYAEPLLNNVFQPLSFDLARGKGFGRLGNRCYHKGSEGGKRKGKGKK